MRPQICPWKLSPVEILHIWLAENSRFTRWTIRGVRQFNRKPVSLKVLSQQDQEEEEEVKPVVRQQLLLASVGHPVIQKQQPPGISSNLLPVLLVLRHYLHTMMCEGESQKADQNIVLLLLLVDLNAQQNKYPSCDIERGIVWFCYHIGIINEQDSYRGPLFALFSQQPPIRIYPYLIEWWLGRGSLHSAVLWLC